MLLGTNDPNEIRVGSTLRSQQRSVKAQDRFPFQSEIQFLGWGGVCETALFPEEESGKNKCMRETYEKLHRINIPLGGEGMEADSWASE